ncbi:MAG TPA: lasso peptide biosynthesis B2 protein [Vicinamibacterales bacterium]|nr:lasso peptide biosynthesis B2 protein [Vicinamibacterales bacterium]
MPSFTRWRGLSWAERRVVLEALLLLPWAKLAVRTVRVDRLVRVRPGSERGQPRVRPGSDRGQNGVRPGSERGQTLSTERLKVGRNCDVSGARVAELVCRVAAYTHAFTCLDAAVAASWAMRRRGWTPILCLGTSMQPDPDRFAAHAWVELDGQPVTPAGAHVPIWRSR